MLSRRSKTVTPLITFLLAAAGCSDPRGVPLAGPAPLQGAPEPEPPAIMRDVAMIDDHGQWTNPHVPGLRTTMDGRLALRVQGAAGVAHFYLHVPEKVDEPIVTASAGIQLLADTEPFQVRLPQADSEGKDGHTAICETAPEFLAAGERPNPYPCGEDLRHDCYDITVISSKALTRFSTRIWGTPVTVEVGSPKTADAHIVRAEVGEAVPGAELRLTDDWTEPAVTNDGRLLTGRLGGVNRRWTNPNTGEELVGSYDLAYSVLPDDADPCDVTGWTAFHPMSHAPYDPAMQRYGLAAYPFRDTEGRLIADGDDLGGSYPWVDREGANVFMTAVPGTITEQPQEDFPRTCVVEGCEDYRYPTNWDRGFLVAGLWTHGKFVHIDARINNMDWSVGMDPRAHMMVDLYYDAGRAVPVRFGSGREGLIDAPAFPANQNILDSTQQLHNHRQAVRPVTPRDVVWLMSTGVATDEVVFDDFLDPRAFIVSNMQASVTPIYNHLGRSTGVPHHHNGQRRRLGADIGGAGGRLYEFDRARPYEDIHLQNAATSLDLEVPAYGLVEEGTGRAEPVALGGFYGRGFWLDGDDRIAYDIPPQDDPAVVEGDWYVGLFVDVRTSEGATRALLTFPDGSSVRLVDRETLQYVVGERVHHEVALPPTDAGWMHLGWRVREDHRELTLLVDGFPFDRFESGRRIFGIRSGTLFVGRGPDRPSGERDAGFRGWVDDFKVLAHDVDPEVACNHAGGTLVRLEGATLGGVADRYPDWAHAEIGASANRRETDRFVCFHDYSRDNAAHLRNIPDDAESLRDVITFPEGPLMAGAPRPDSSSNAFCLSCHTEGGKGGLGLDALELRAGVSAEDDPRRQPFQPPPRVFGNIPARWIPAGPGPGSPAVSMLAPDEGVQIDRWILPHAP